MSRSGLSVTVWSMVGFLPGWLSDQKVTVPGGDNFGGR
jgi:hypothetical protein